MANQWFKFYGGDYLSDPKIARLTPSERSCWITLLSIASMSDDGVIKYLTVESLLDKSGIRWNPYATGDYEDCQKILVTLSSLKMISVEDDISEIRIINWNKRQDTSLTNAERQAKYREKHKKNNDSNEKVTKQSNKSNARIEENRIEENRIEHTWGTIGDSFWLIYPEKVAKAKALQSWIKLTEEEKQNALIAIKKQVEANHFRGKDGKDYIPHPATWLNQKRWEDEVKVKTNTSGSIDLRTKK